MIESGVALFFYPCYHSKDKKRDQVSRLKSDAILEMIKKDQVSRLIFSEVLRLDALQSSVPLMADFKLREERASHI